MAPARSIPRQHLESLPREVLIHRQCRGKSQAAHQFVVVPYAHSEPGDGPGEREFYVLKAVQIRWLVRDVARRIDAALFKGVVLNPPKLSTRFYGEPEPTGTLIERENER